MLDTLLVALIISIDTAQVKEFPQKAEVEFKKNDLKENIIKSALNFHNSSPTTCARSSLLIKIGLPSLSKART